MMHRFKAIALAVVAVTTSMAARATDVAAPVRPAPTTAAAAGAAASADSAQLSAFKKAIRSKYDLKEKAFAAHDAETIVTKFYSSDVISAGEGEGIFIGRDAIRPLYQAVVKDNTVKVESVHTFVDGDAGWDWADFHVFPTDPKAKPFTFAILFLWAKVNGQWICKGDFFMTGSFRSGTLQSAPAAPTK